MLARKAFYIILVVIGGILHIPSVQALRLDQTQFTPQPQNETLLHITQTGRYSLQVSSSQGTAIELIDRMAGVIAHGGSTGSRDGRIDIFLEKGEYKVRLRSHERSSEPIQLQVYAYQEAQPVSDPLDSPQLQELTLQQESLQDLQQRSYWIHLKDRQRLRIEALGRNLSDCRFWKDGEWLVDVSPEMDVFEPVSGQPMTYVEFFHDLNAGLYLLTCYGGPALSWANEEKGQPFFIRRGIPTLPANGRQVVAISPFGRDVYRVSGQTTFFQLQQKEKIPTSIALKRVSEDSRHSRGGQEAAIHKKSKDPWVSLSQYSGYDQWVTVQGQPGDSPVLSFFVKRHEYTFHPQTGAYWISSLNSASGRDAIDATSILGHPSSGSPVATQKLDIGSQQALRRKVNLLGKIQVHLYIQESGAYIVRENSKLGAQGEYRIEPFLMRYPWNYRPPEFQSANQVLNLSAGYHVLTIVPESKGILEFSLQWQATPLPDWEQPSPSVQYSGILWPEVSLPSYNSSYELNMNERHEVESGVIIRSLPLNLETPLTVNLSPGQHVPISIQVPTDSILQVLQDQPVPFELTEGDRVFQTGQRLIPGHYQLELKNTSQQAADFTLKTAPIQPDPPPLSQIRDQTTPLPILTAESPHFSHYDRTEQKHFTLIVKEPGLYRLETSGRLATRLKVRTRLITSLFTETQNGIGRNALIQQYLKLGEYLVTVQPRGRSTGRMGVHLRRAPLITKEGLAPGILQRLHLNPDEAVRYRFQIHEGGRYHLTTHGLGKQFAYRLDDSQGWPFLSPGGRGAIVRYFQPGHYEYYSLPEPLESRRITQLAAVEKAASISGKGPHSLTLNQSVSNTWRESTPRNPDRYEVTLTAATDVQIKLSEKMQFTLRSTQTKQSLVEQMAQWKGTLSEGTYTLEVTGIENDDFVDYTLSMTTQDLVPGLTQTVRSLPATFNVNLSKAALVDLSSFGNSDVKASLWDANTQQKIVESDDSPNDWNFHISQHLKPQQYQLKLVGIGRQYGSIAVSMVARNERQMSQQGLPFSIDQALNQEVLKIPLQAIEKTRVVHFQSTSTHPIRLALLHQNQVVAEGSNEMWIPLRAHDSYVLLVWGTSQIASRTTIQGRVLPEVEHSMQSSNTLPPFSEEVPPVLWLTHASHITYQTQTRLGSALLCPEIHQPCQSIGTGPFSLRRQEGWLVCTSQCSGQSITLVPFTLQPDAAVTLDLEKEPLFFDLTQLEDAPILLEFSSVDSSLGAMAMRSNEENSALFNWEGMWREGPNTLTVFPGPGTFRGKVWQARPPATTLKTRLILKPYPVESQTSLTNQESKLDGVIAPGRSHRIVIEGPPHRSEILLSKQMVAASWNGQQLDGVVAATHQNQSRMLAVTKNHLILINRGERSAPYRVERRGNLSQSLSTLDPHSGFESIFSTSGILRLKIQNIPKGQRLFFQANQAQGRLLTTTGYILEGESFELPPQTEQGVLELHYAPGYVRIWTAPLEAEKQRFMAMSPEEVSPQPIVGASDLSNQAQRWKFQIDEPIYIVVDTDTPGALALWQQQVLRTTVATQTEGAQLIYFAQPGNYELWTRPVRGLPHTGKLRLRKIRPHLLSDSSNTSQPWLLRSGEIQVFAFHVATQSNVGIGVQAETDALDGRLFDKNFQLLGKGPLVFRNLAPGYYLFTVKTHHRDTLPVQYTPVLLGHQGSQQQVPESVMRQYTPSH